MENLAALAYELRKKCSRYDNGGQGGPYRRRYECNGNPDGALF